MVTHYENEGFEWLAYMRSASVSIKDILKAVDMLGYAMLGYEKSIRLYKSNNWLKLHGYPMRRKNRRTKNERMCFGKRRLQELNRELRRNMRSMQYVP